MQLLSNVFPSCFFFFFKTRKLPPPSWIWIWICTSQEPVNGYEPSGELHVVSGLHFSPVPHRGLIGPWPGFPYVELSEVSPMSCQKSPPWPVRSLPHDLSEVSPWAVRSLPHELSEVSPHEQSKVSPMYLFLLWRVWSEFRVTDILNTFF